MKMNVEIQAISASSCEILFFIVCVVAEERGGWLCVFDCDFGLVC
jgi:hypothetical protein